MAVAMCNVAEASQNTYPEFAFSNLTYPKCSDQSYSSLNNHGSEFCHFLGWRWQNYKVFNLFCVCNHVYQESKPSPVVAESWKIAIAGFT